jgi:hypothetical protein
MRVLPLLALAALAAACSDGAAGDKGLVRFSLVGDYVETDGFADVATNSTLRIVLQHPQQLDLPTDNATYTRLSLRAEGLAGAPAPDVFPTGIAEFGVYFARAGRYRLVATDAGVDLDSITATVVDPDALTFSEEVTVSTNLEGCSRSDRLALAVAEVAPNQAAFLSVVPRAKGRPLIGLPMLTADAVGGHLTTVPSSYSLALLGLTVVPRPNVSSVELTVRDLGNGLVATHTLPVKAANAGGSCN